MPRNNNRLVIHDCIHDLTPAYVAGALAMRSQVPHWANPHRIGSQRHSDWNHGHDNEAAGEHHPFGIDVILAKPRGQVFEMDPAQPRNAWGEIIAA